MSLETLLAAANFVEANSMATGLTRGRDGYLHSTLVSENLSVHFEKFIPGDVLHSSEPNAEARIIGGGACAASGNTRQLHNKLEKSRRAALKECFIGLRQQIPLADERRSSHLDVLQMAIRYVKALNETAHELECSRLELERQRSMWEQRLLTTRLTTATASSGDGNSSEARSPSTDTADDSPMVSDDDGEGCVTCCDSVKSSSENLVVTTSMTTLPMATAAANCTSALRSLSTVSSSSTSSQRTIYLPKGSRVVMESARNSDAVVALAGLHTPLCSGGSNTKVTGTSADLSTILDVQAGSLSSSCVDNIRATTGGGVLVAEHCPVGAPLLGAAIRFSDPGEKDRSALQKTHRAAAATQKVWMRTLAHKTKLQLQSKVHAGGSSGVGSCSVPVPVLPIPHSTTSSLQTTSRILHVPAAPHGSLVQLGTSLTAQPTSSNNAIAQGYFFSFDHNHVFASSSSSVAVATSQATLAQSSPITSVPASAAIGQLVFCPTFPGADGFSILPFLSTSSLPFVGGKPSFVMPPNGYTLLCGAPTTAVAATTTMIQPVPMLQMSSLLPSLTVSSSSIALPLGSVITTTNNSSTVFVVPS